MVPKLIAVGCKSLSPAGSEIRLRASGFALRYAVTSPESEIRLGRGAALRGDTEGDLRFRRLQVAGEERSKLWPPGTSETSCSKSLPAAVSAWIRCSTSM